MSGRSRAARLVAVLGASVVALAATGVAHAGDAAERPVPFDEMEGVSPEWTAVLNGYVQDPATYGPRLIAIERDAGAELPPIFRMAAADAYLRAGNRRGAERLFEESIAAGEGYPWEDFANLGMGTLRLASGDEAGAEIYFGRLADAGEATSRVLGNLGLGAAYAASGRFAEAQAAFDETATADDPEIAQAGRLGSALALHGAGDLAGAAEAFDALADENPQSSIAQDARYAAARARLDMGERHESAAALRELVQSCAGKRKGRRAPRALRKLDARAMGRDWLRGYRKVAWGKLRADGRSMFSIDGCALARATLDALERGDVRLAAAQPVAAVNEPHAPASSLGSAGPDGRPPAEAEAAPTEETGSVRAWLLAVAALATALGLWRFVARGRAAS